MSWIDQNPALFAHWQDVPLQFWNWKNFHPSELACKGDGSLLIHPPSIDALQALRDALGRPLVVFSAYRSRAYNAQVGGAPASQHMEGRAFDLSVSGHDPHRMEELARAAGFQGFGYYRRQGFLHVDTGPARSWGDPWPVSAAPRFAPIQMPEPRGPVSALALPDLPDDPQDEPEAANMDAEPGPFRVFRNLKSKVRARLLGD